MHWTEHTYVVEGVRLHLRRAGEGAPVLLLHGLTDSGRYWSRIAAGLAEARQVFVLDQRGHGLSDAPDSGYRLADFAHDAAQVIQQLGIAPTAVVGHSLGARVALTLAAAHPHLVTRLVLEDPPPDILFSRWKELGVDEQRFAWFAGVRDLQALSREYAVAHGQARFPHASLQEAEDWADGKLRVRRVLWEPGGMYFEPDWLEALAQVSSPVLLVRGEPQLGSLLDDVSEREALQVLRHGESVQIQGAGHLVHLEQADAFLDAVLPFLDERQAAVATS